MRHSICTRLFLIALSATTIFYIAGPCHGQDAFAEADANQDGKVNQQELVDYVSSKVPDFDRFDELMRELDADEDSSLSTSEFEKRFDAIPAVMARPKSDQSSHDETNKTAGEKPASTAELFPGVQGRSDILLITSDELGSSWTEFAIWKTKTGRPTRVLTIKQIEERFQGDDIQAKIREACLWHIENESTRWVILGGDSNGRKGGHVPDRDTDHSGFFRYKNLPTDIYYISEGDWDANDDGNYGHFEDDMDAVNYTNPNASIGRIPVSTPADVAAYTAKVIEYESAYPTDGFASKFVYTCPEPGAYPKLNTSLKTVEEDWKGDVSQFFANKSPWDEDKQGDHDLTPAHWAEMINNGQVAKMHMHGHGILPMWVLEDHTELTAETVATLKNRKAYPLITTVSCFTGQFDDRKDPCITESMLRQPAGGAIAIIAPSREGIPVFHSEADFRLMMTEGKMDGTTETLTRFWQHALSAEPTIGEAFRAAKADMAEHAKQTDGYHFVQCELNLLGDPSLDPRAKNPEPIDAEVLVQDKGGIASFFVKNVQGCHVCIWDGGENFQVVKANSAGEATIPADYVNDESTKQVFVSAFGPNRNSWTKKIELRK